ncbi:MAG TPA: cytochrome c biogenesis protein ResB [Rectinemataceae bacterium]|nr:cytochrome c biogenesis protein ResB [Rectinemataceae bacterium]
MRLAIVLIAVIIVFSLLSTLIPQGRSSAELAKDYGPVLGTLISASGLGNYTSSLIFFVSIGMFVLNLSVCSVDRFIKRLKSRAAKHFGPDIIHLSLLVLAVGAMMTSTVRREQDFTMVAGDAVNLPNGYTMQLKNFEFLQYPDGRPKAWISTVDVKQGDRLVRQGYRIEVNHPLALGMLKVYQMNYSSEATVDFADASGVVQTMKIGEGFSMGSDQLILVGARPADNSGQGWIAQFRQYRGNDAIASFEFGIGEKIGSYTVRSISARELTGLRAAVDPGFIPVLIALILMAIGLTMTSIHKSKGVD